MAVNLVAQVGRARAVEILNTSFAQFQADRSVVGLVRTRHDQSEAMAGYAEAMACHLGDFREYAALRHDLGRLEEEGPGPFPGLPLAEREDGTVVGAIAGR